MNNHLSIYKPGAQLPSPPAAAVKVKKARASVRHSSGEVLAEPSAVQLQGVDGARCPA